MHDFSQLLDGLVYTRSRNAKLKLIGDYLKATPDPDRGYALAGLTGELDLPAGKPAAGRAIAEERGDPVLLYMSRDYVGDMAETVSLLWPKGIDQPADIDDGTLRIANVVERLASLGRAEAPGALAEMLDHLDASGRYALSSSLPARCASAFPRVSRSWRWPRRSISTSMRWRRCGTASARPICRSSPGPRAGALSRRWRVCPSSGPSCWRIRLSRRGSRLRSEEHTSELQSLMRNSYA